MVTENQNEVIKKTATDKNSKNHANSQRQQSVLPKTIPNLKVNLQLRRNPLPTGMAHSTATKASSFPNIIFLFRLTPILPRQASHLKLNFTFSILRSRRLLGQDLTWKISLGIRHKIVNTQLWPPTSSLKQQSDI